MSWADRLAAKPLPALRETHSRLSRLLGRDDTTNWQIEDILRRDPALALLVLGDVNRQSRRFGRDDVTTFDGAIGLLGRERLKTIVRALPESCIALFDPLPKEGLKVALGRAFESAQQAEDWALARREAVAEQHYHAALLASTPELALWHEAPDLAARAYIQAQEQGVGLDEAFSATLGEDWPSVCTELADRWGLPALLRELWAPSGNISVQAGGIQLALTLAHHASHGWHAEHTRALRPAVADYLGMDEATGWMRCQRTAIHGGTGLLALGLHPSARTLPAADSSPWPLESPLAPVMLRVDPVQSLRESLSELKGSNALLQQLLKHLRAELGLGRLVLMMLDGDKNRLESRFAVGVPASDPLRGLILPLNAGDLFSALLKKHQPLWLHAANRPAFLPRLPEEARAALAHADTFISPLQINHEPVGLLVAQRGDDSRALTSDDFRLFNDLQAVAHAALNQAR